MKNIAFGLCVFGAFVTMSGNCLAHRVNVFAFVDGDEIQVECGFSKRQRVKHGKLTITDLETGALVLEGVTDERGIFRFRPPDEFLQTGHGLNISLDAGEGHRDDWKISAEELRALSRPVPPQNSNAGGTPPPLSKTADAPPPVSAASADGRPSTLSDVDAAELEAIIGRVLDEKLAPFRSALARQHEDEPGLRDIAGGIGWILGLLGLATYMKYRR